MIYRDGAGQSAPNSPSFTYPTDTQDISLVSLSTPNMLFEIEGGRLFVNNVLSQNTGNFSALGDYNVTLRKETYDGPLLIYRDKILHATFNATSLENFGGHTKGIYFGAKNDQSYTLEILR